DCMGKDAGADQGAIKALQKQKTTLDQAIAQARQQLRGDDPLEGDGTNADDNVMGDAWAESAKTQEAVRSFAKLASLASGKPVDYDAVMKSIMGDGSAITGWVVAGGDKASLLSAGFAISQAFAETEAKIRGDKTVYYKKADLVKAYRLALDAARQGAAGAEERQADGLAHDSARNSSTAALNAVGSSSNIQCLPPAMIATSAPGTCAASARSTW